jgi:hypothetical protein
MIPNFEEILSELSYRVDGGIPDLNKQSHVNHLIDILRENGISDASQLAQKARVYFSYLTEASGKTDAGLQAAIEFFKSKTYKNAAGKDISFSTAIDYGNRNKEGDTAHIQAMNDLEGFLDANKGKYGDMEKAIQPKPEQPKANVFGKNKGASVFQPAQTDNPTTPTKKADTPTPTQSGPIVAPNFDKVMAIPAVKRGLGILDNKEKAQAKEFFQDTRKFYDETTSPKDRAKLANEMIEKYQLSASPNRKKLYLGIFGSKEMARKMLGEGGFAEKMLKDLESASGKTLGGAKGGSNASEIITKAAKPDLSDKSKATNDQLVANIFKTDPLSYLESKFYELHGPLGADGKLIGQAGGANSKAYFQHSVAKNKSLDNTIEVLKKLEPEVSPKVREALEAHKAVMQDVASKFKIPSAEAEKAVGTSYGKMFQAIAQNSNEQIAGSLMKQFAEMALYDTETAKGDECYLPSAGNFPSGDKIKITRKGTKIEKVASVSVKYGLTGGEYGNFGFPGETAQYQKYHPDVDYRSRNNSHPGDNGYSLGVRNDLIDDTTKFAKMFKESAFKDVVKDPAALLKVMQEEKKEIDKLRASVNPKSFADMLPHLKQLREINERYATKMEKLVDKERLESKVGFDNANIILGGPMQMATAISFAATLNTSQGLTSIEHNHQVIQKDGSYSSHTDTGSPDLKLWKLTFRGFDKRGGGMITSYNSNRKTIQRKGKK